MSCGLELSLSAPWCHEPRVEGPAVAPEGVFVSMWLGLGWVSVGSLGMMSERAAPPFQPVLSLPSVPRGGPLQAPLAP